MVSNPNLDNIKSLLSTFYNNYIIDNKYILKELEDIKSSENSNRFSIIVKKLFSLNIYNNGETLFLNKVTKDDSSDNLYAKNIIILLGDIARIFSDIIIAYPNDYIEYYKSIQTVKISPSANADKSTYYEINRSGLHIYLEEENSTFAYYDTNSNIAKRAIDIVFDKTKDRYNADMNVDETDVIKNHLIFLTSLNDFAIKSQVEAYNIYAKLLLTFYMFYYNSELLLIKNKDAMYSSEYDFICYFYNNFSTYLMVLKSQLSESIYVNETTDNNFVIECKCTQICPYIKFEALGESINVFIIDSTLNIRDNYYVTYGDHMYEIIAYTVNDKAISDVNPNYKNVASFTINATGGSCKNTGLKYLPNMAIGTQDFIIVKKKSVKDFQKDYITIGKDLNVYNMQIEKSKKKINKLYKKYNVQKGLGDSLKTRFYVYIGILAIISIIYLLMAFEIINSFNQINVAVSIFIIIVVMLVANYFSRTTFIESFENASASSATGATVTESGKVAVNTKKCESLQSVSEKTNYIQSNILIFDSYVNDILSLSSLYLSNIDSIDLYKKLSNSLKNERRTFKNHTDMYKYKERISKESSEIIKHNIIKRAAYINLVTILYLIYALSFVIYLVYPQYINAIYIIALILILINVAYFYLIILHPVRTTARNNYWTKPVTSTINMLNT